MGADFIVGVIAHKRGEVINFEAGRNFLTTVDFSDEDLVQSLIDEGLDEGDETLFDVDDDTYSGALSYAPIPEAIRKWMLHKIDDLVNSLGGRDVSVLHIRDLEVYISGEMSWGDAPETAQIWWTIDKVPGLLGSMGFEENWHEEEVVVTPEEEAAAVDSIKKVNA